nr:hypothetical protein BaRGS_032254 [Batillaria attramentaria]
MAVTPGGSVVMKANIRLTGSSPDLTLTIQLYNIQEEEDGEWTLYIANDKGDGQVDFKIKIADTPFEITLPQNEMDVTPGGSVVLKANIRLTGSPPDLTLTIHLDNIQEEEDGEWTLYIADDKGDGQVDFKINITDNTPVFFHADTEAGPDDGYLTPVPTRKSKRGAAGGRDRTPASLSSEDYSESYERPVNPDYTTPNPQYEPLRHLYESVRQDGSTKKSRKQKN